MLVIGEYEKLGELDYFVPYSLPPKSPNFEMSPNLVRLYGESMHSLGRLNEMAVRVPDIERFIKAYIIKEALLSSEIEGIETTMIDVLTNPLFSTKPSKETQLVLNYTDAVKVALEMVMVEKTPLVSRVILAAHEALMGMDESLVSPGGYRKQSVRVGSFVPPPAQKVLTLIADLEKYINRDNNLPPLIKAGLVHVQFETIHPFLDGNGRIGRLLIVLMLIESGLLSVPILYPSYYFKKHHLEYYQRLNNVRTKGDFEGWITYYLHAIKESSDNAYVRAKEIENLEDEIRIQIEQDSLFQKMRVTALQALRVFFQYPIITVKVLSENLGKAYNTADHLIKQFTKAGILQEAEEKRRGKNYCFKAYFNLLERD